MSNYPAIGEFVGKYKVESVLGKGYTSTVYKARHKHLNTDVALKVLSFELVEKDSSVKDIFFNEALNNAKLVHNNLVRIIDIDDENEYTYIVMEFIDGLTLDSIINHVGIVEPLKALRVGIELCNALKHAMTFNIIHRDIKPANIMITKNSDVKLTDFGLSKTLNEINKFESNKGEIFGTPYYMSPEQFQDSFNVDHRSDMYSLGVTLYHLATGKLPFETNNLGELIAMHINDNPVSPDKVTTQVTREFARVIMKLLSKSPDQRFKNYDELKHALEKVELEYKVAHVSNTSNETDNSGFKNTFENSLLEKIERYQKEFKHFNQDTEEEQEEVTNSYDKNISEEEIIGRVLTNLNKQYQEEDIFKKSPAAKTGSLNENVTEKSSGTDRLKQKYQKYFKKFGGVDINEIISDADK